MMTKQDYELIAQTIIRLRELRDDLNDNDVDHAFDVLSRSMATVFAVRNPRFDEDKFLAACGVTTITTEKE